MKHGREIYTVQATKNLAGLILAEGVGYDIDRLVFLVLLGIRGKLCL